MECTMTSSAAVLEAGSSVAKSCPAVPAIAFLISVIGISGNNFSRPEVAVLIKTVPATERAIPPATQPKTSVKTIGKSRTAEWRASSPCKINTWELRRIYPCKLEVKRNVIDWKEDSGGTRGREDEKKNWSSREDHLNWEN